MDNDLMNLWLRAAFLTEPQTRDVITELQETRDEVKAAEADEDKRITELCAKVSAVTDKMRARITAINNASDALITALHEIEEIAQ